MRFLINKEGILYSLDVFIENFYKVYLLVRFFGDGDRLGKLFIGLFVFILFIIDRLFLLECSLCKCFGCNLSYFW